MAKEQRTCSDCSFACFVDYGYSNWTTEGTEFYCGKRLHPNGHFDRFYDEDKRLNYAQKCSGFEGGLPIEMDVDHENEEKLTPEQKKILETAMSN